MTKHIQYPANSRGHATHGWLNSYHTFSFADYYDPNRVHFGVLRVLNDDTVAAGMGFGRHPHDNMEIISIPLEGDLEHQDSMGNTAVIRHGDIQVMSAGTGITHSEYNKNKDLPVKFLQIWVFPDKRNVAPRYGQITLNEADRHNQLQQIISPEENAAGLWIHQRAWFQLGKFDQDKTFNYSIQQTGNGAYLFVISGSFSADGITLNTRDGLGVVDASTIEFKSLESNSEILIMDVPMELK